MTHTNWFPKITERSFLPVLALLLILLTACSSDDADDEDAAQDEGIPVVVEAASTGPVTEKINTTGTVMAEHQALISAEVAGRVIELPVNLGSKVEKGTVLARLDPTVARAQQQQADANLAQARAGLHLAEVNLERIESLHGQAAVSEQSLDQARIELDSRTAGVEAAEAGLNLSQKALADCSVRAPFAGTVAQVQLELGTLVAPGTPAFQLVSVDHLFVLSAVSSSVIGYVVENLPVRLLVPSLQEEPFLGYVARLGPSADVRTRTYPVEINIDEDKGLLRPGMMTRVEIVLEQRESAVLVPRASVLGESENHVFVVSDGLAYARPVETGLSVGDQVEIRSGLDPGELVVSLGQQKLRDKALVRIYDMPKLPEAEPGSPAASTSANSK
jgi:membrane fusion protein (multidrug efflux system)